MEKLRSWSFNCSFMSLFHSLIKISSHKQIAPSWFYFPYLDKLPTAKAKQKRVAKVWENAYICAHCFPRPIMYAINAADTASHMHYNFFFVRVWISEMIKAKGSVRIPNACRALVLFWFFFFSFNVNSEVKQAFFSRIFPLIFTTRQFHTCQSMIKSEQPSGKCCLELVLDGSKAILWISHIRKSRLFKFFPKPPYTNSRKWKMKYVMFLYTESDKIKARKLKDYLQGRLRNLAELSLKFQQRKTISEASLSRGLHRFGGLSPRFVPY